MYTTDNATQNHSIIFSKINHSVLDILKQNVYRAIIALVLTVHGI